MNTVLHQSQTRGQANHGWLKAQHTFSFGEYYDQSRIHFGMLRVLNDDIIEPVTGFDTHPHDNMEIISIPIKGILEHKDDMGHVSKIQRNDIQVMSAGSGIHHSEYNPSETEPVNMLQIWVMPDKRNVEPRYDQMNFDPQKRINRFQKIVTPHADNGNLWIHQKCWFSLINLEPEVKIDYCIHNKGNGIYVFIIEGESEVEKIRLKERDGLGLWDIDRIRLLGRKNSEILIMEVPMF